MPALHVVVPIFNERNTVEPCLDRIVAASLPDGFTRRLWLVDDHSDADSFASVKTVVARLAAAGHDLSLDRHTINRGKGATLQTAFDEILLVADDGDLVIIQDADLEYDPSDYARLMAPIIAGETNAVIGNRWAGATPPRGLKRRVHAIGNGVLTSLSNAMTGYRLNDMECCYKLLTIPVLRRVRPMLTEPRFGIEPQLVASLARIGEGLVEVPIKYEPRGFGDGKKIGWTDGVRALIVIARERFGARPRTAKTQVNGEATS